MRAILDNVHEKQRAEAKFQVMPPLSDEEITALAQSIRKYGVLQPVDVDGDGEILEGHHRAWIAEHLNVRYPRRQRRELTTDAEKIAFALTTNIDRRHLNQEQKRDLLAQSLRVEPSLSNVAHAKRTGTTDKTAASVRRELEESSEIPRIEKRTDRAGHKRPATSKRKPSYEVGPHSAGRDNAKVIPLREEPASAEEPTSDLAQAVTRCLERDWHNAIKRMTWAIDHRDELSPNMRASLLDAADKFAPVFDACREVLREN